MNTIITKIFAFLSIVGLCSTVYSRVLVVNRTLPGAYSEVTTALDNSIGNDTIIVTRAGEEYYSIGTYTLNHTITMIGQGWDEPYATVLYGKFILSAGATGSEFNGFNLLSGNGGCFNITIDTGVVVLKRLMVSCSYLNATFINSTLSSISSLWITDCLFVRGSSGQRLLSTTGSGTLICENSAFVGDMSLQNLSSTGSAQFSHFVLIGTNPGSSHRLISFSNGIATTGSSMWTDAGVWSHCATYNVQLPGEGNIQISSSPFVDQTGGDYHLITPNPCRNAGIGFDRDGSVADLGIYGGQNPFVDHGIPDFPFVSTMFVPTTIPAGQPLQINATGRVGPR